MKTEFSREVAVVVAQDIPSLTSAVDRYTVTLTVPAMTYGSAALTSETN